MAKRRKFLAGLGALVSGSAAAMGTGAFTSTEAERSINVNVAEDTNAFLGLDSISGSPNSEDYARVTENGELQLFATRNVDGDGFNLDSVTLVDDLFKITNQSSQGQYVYLGEIGAPSGPEGGGESGFGTRPTGQFFVGFYAPGDRDGEWDGISYGSAPEDPNNPNTRGPNQPDSKAPADAAPFDGSGEVQPPGKRANPQFVGAGESINVGMVVDTTSAGETFADEDTKLQAGDLLNRVVVKAKANPDDAPTTL